MATAELETWLRRVGVKTAFLALAELLPNAAVVVTDGEGRVLLWTGESERLLGFHREEILGQPCPNGLLCDVGGERDFGERVRVRRADGAMVLVQHYRRSFLQDGTISGTIHVLVFDPRPQDVPATLPLPSDTVSFHGLLSREPAMFRVFQTIRNVAETSATVLVRGESGTGKELVARAIHAESLRRDKPFIAVNCAAFTPTLLESELFGHVKGAFTGAAASRRGIFAQADGGTLFLDEVGELTLDTQAKLLRVLQERSFVPVGGTEPVQVDVRIVAATHRALREEVKAGRFREDLMYRLRVVPIFLPPLRERRQDIELLLRHFTEQLNRRGPRRVQGFTPAAMRVLLDHAWPGNIREMQNVVEYAFAVGRGPEVDIEDLPPEFREVRRSMLFPASPPVSPPASPPVPLPASPEPPDEQERRRVIAALDEAGGDLEAAAAALGVSRTTFWRLRKRYGL